MPAKKIKVKDQPGLVRDSHSKAIINVDNSNYANSRFRKKRLIEKEKEIQSLKNDVDFLRKQIEEIIQKIK